MNAAAKLIKQCVAENARTALDQTEYQKKYSGLAERFNRAKERLSQVSRAITERQAKRERAGGFVSSKNGMEIFFKSYSFFRIRLRSMKIGIEPCMPVC